MSKVLVVDDEKSIVTLLTVNIEKAGFQTDTAYDGIEAIKKVEANVYDLIVLDIMLPKMDGMEVCTYLRKNEIETPILMLTAKNEEGEKIQGLERGADDYMTKPFSPKEVVARIKAILRRTNRSILERDKPIRIHELTIYPELYNATLAGKKLAFTRKEFELLLYLARNKGEILARDRILKKVWDYDFVGDTRIVDVHVSRLREKIEEDTKNPLYIKTIRGLGYKMEMPTL